MKKNKIILLGLIIIVGIFLLVNGIFMLAKEFIKNVNYETSRDEIIYSPSGEYFITLRYDHVSRPYIFKDNKLIFETNRAGFNETVNFKVEWKSENEILLYIDKEKYKDDRYNIIIE